MTDEETELEQHLQEAAETSAVVSKLHRHMIDFLRDKVAKFRDNEPDAVDTLRDPIAKDEIADLYESLMTELDDSKQWDEQDVLEAAALYLLMALGMTDEETEEQDEDDDDEEPEEEDPEDEKENDGTKGGDDD